MSGTIEVHNGKRATFNSAKETQNTNLVNQVAFRKAGKEFEQTLWDCRETIEALVRHHLGLSDQDACRVRGKHLWVRGSFNVCIPVKIESPRSPVNNVMFRCAMPHKLAEAQHPGTMDEKTSCEVGTYVWCQHHCPEIRIPFLYGFGFSDGRHFTHERQRPWYLQLARMLRHLVAKFLPSPTLSHYTPHRTSQSLPTAYMLLEHIGPETGQMLSRTWELGREDKGLRGRLFHGLARIILSLGRIPQPRIGSLQFHDDCTIALTNRPMPCCLVVNENDGAPRIIPRNETYTCTETFVADMLAFHDGSFLQNPNSTFCEEDCRALMAVRALMRTVAHHFLDRDRRHGPFALQVTDLHASNIFVDEQWNVTCLIDLEWIAALPLGMIHTPRWLTGRGVDEITGRHKMKFASVRSEFMKIFEKEEISMGTNLEDMLTPIMDESWASGATWFWACLTSVDAMYGIASEHIYPRYSHLTESATEFISAYWCRASAKIVSEKVEQHERYQVELEKLFQEVGGA